MLPFIFSLILMVKILPSWAQKEIKPYVEFCAGDQYQSKVFGKGNPAGHSLLYIEGLCKDEGKNYPRLKNCLGTENHSGVGISLDSGFKNVRWIAVPTRDLTLIGADEKQFNNESINKIIELSAKYQIFEGVEMWEEKFPDSIKKYPDRLSQYVAYTIGTDLAFAAARNVYCQKIQLNQKNDLTTIATYLNQLNDDAQKNNYQYTINDNCTHLSVNTLSEVDLAKGRIVKRERNIIGTILNLTLPKSEFLKLSRLTTNDQFNPWYVWRNEALRKHFLTHNTLPYQAGNLVSKIPIIPNNEYFTDKNSTFFSFPVLGKSLKNSTRLETTDLEKNLDHYLERMKAGLEALESSKEIQSINKSTPQGIFFGRYKEYLVSEINSLLSLQKSLNGCD